jgi:hypothetical protein
MAVGQALQEERMTCFSVDELEEMITNYVKFWATYCERSGEASSCLLAEKANKLEKYKLEIARQLLEMLKTERNKCYGVQE